MPGGPCTASKTGKTRKTRGPFTESCADGEQQGIKRDSWAACGWRYSRNWDINFEGGH